MAVEMCIRDRVEDPIEKYSVLRAKLAVDRADVCVIMIDAEQGITEQDERIAGIAHEAGKPSVICINTVSYTHLAVYGY